MNFRFPQLDDRSFWLGAAVASVFWWALGALRPVARQIGEKHRANRDSKKGHGTSSVEEHYRRVVLQRAQSLHLAAPLFSLEEVVLPPRLMAPPVRIEPGSPVDDDDIVASTIPYLPGWPELSSIYQGPTLSLSEALSGDSDIVLTGAAGAGKTVALACLASDLARRNLVPGLADDTLPILIHVADLALPLKNDAEALRPLVDAIAETAHMRDLPRIPDFIQRSFREGRALLLLDGSDDLTPDGLAPVIDFIKAIKRLYPGTRIVTTACPDYLDGLVTLNFVPFSMAAWGHRQRLEFLDKWGDLWTRYVSVEAWAQSGPQQVDPLLLDNWLIHDNEPATPLEFTLRTWGAYAGDLRGSKPAEAIATHLRRLKPPDAPFEALEMLGLQVSLAMEPVFDPRRARDWIKSFEPEETPAPTGLDENDKKEKTRTPRKDKQPAPSLGMLTKLANSGLLCLHRGGRMRFVNPVFCGYLAGKALTSGNAERILSQPSWSGRNLSLRYLAMHGDIGPLVERLLEQEDQPLQRNLFLAARWLKDAPSQAPWRGQVMSGLASLLQQEGLPLGLRGQAVAAFILSGDPGAALLFRRMYSIDSPELLQLCALGSGALQDVKAIELLSGLLSEKSPGPRRAACLALIAVGTTEALEAIASALLHGEEDLRRSAAEALANHPVEGHPMLRDAAAMEDILVRRAATYGLGRIRKPWADQLLSELQVEKEWIVRTSATEALDKRQRPNPHIPQRLPPPSESPWLIEYAGKQGLGISPDVPATDILLTALRTGTADEKLASLPYLRMMPYEGVFGALYQSMYGGEPELREAVFQTFQEMAARGVEVPDPHQFGVG
ncbi:MAG: HEAT repeat domain-containing protein [Chloroflexi bacterium]|nr:HEAT repeat domain-containing protein [Chloroflexota bacterium]